jgi:diacylglycerol kinase (ATP)
VRSFGYAFEGVVAMLRSQPNAWVHLVAACLALGLGLALGLSAVELALIVLTIGVVLAAEAANTALEHVCDLVSPDYHPLVKRAKDISAAAVLLAAAAAVLVAALVYIPHLRR